jgi:hypothetical protein
MPVYGRGEKGVLIIRNGPTVEEDKAGHYWCGSLGWEKPFQKALSDNGINLLGDAWTVGSLSCAEYHHDTNDNLRRECCGAHLFSLIKTLKPTFIFLLGPDPIKTVIGSRWKKSSGFDKWRGWAIPDQKYRAWLFPMLPGNSIDIAVPNPDEHRTIFINDLEEAAQYIRRNEPFPLRFDETRIHIIRDPVNMVLSGNFFVFDYETSGKKVQRAGHKIYCMSICGGYESWVFPYPEKGTDSWKTIKALLQNSTITKGAHNMKYEDTVTKVLGGYNVKPWVWDSMQAAHILDNRPGISGLKFQAYINFGISGYDDEVAPYLESKEKDNNAFNKVPELISQPGGLEKLLKYCAMDSLYEYDLTMKQWGMLNCEYN